MAEQKSDVDLDAPDFNSVNLNEPVPVNTPETKKLGIPNFFHPGELQGINVQYRVDIPDVNVLKTVNLPRADVYAFNGGILNVDNICGNTNPEYLLFDKLSPDLDRLIYGMPIAYMLKECEQNDIMPGLSSIDLDTFGQVDFVTLNHKLKSLKKTSQVILNPGVRLHGPGINTTRRAFIWVTAHVLQQLQIGINVRRNDFWMDITAYRHYLERCFQTTLNWQTPPLDTLRSTGSKDSERIYRYENVVHRIVGGHQHKFIYGAIGRFDPHFRNSSLRCSRMIFNTSQIHVIDTQTWTQEERNFYGKFTTLITTTSAAAFATEVFSHMCGGCGLKFRISTSTEYTPLYFLLAAATLVLIPRQFFHDEGFDLFVLLAKMIPIMSGNPLLHWNEMIGGAGLAGRVTTLSRADDRLATFFDMLFFDTVNRFHFINLEHDWVHRDDLLVYRGFPGTAGVNRLPIDGSINQAMMAAMTDSIVQLMIGANGVFETMNRLAVSFSGKRNGRINTRITSAILCSLSVVQVHYYRTYVQGACFPMSRASTGFEQTPITIDLSGAYSFMHFGVAEGEMKIGNTFQPITKIEAPPSFNPIHLRDCFRNWKAYDFVLSLIHYISITFPFLYSGKRKQVIYTVREVTKRRYNLFPNDEIYKIINLYYTVCYQDPTVLFGYNLDPDNIGMLLSSFLHGGVDIPVTYLIDDHFMYDRFHSYSPVGQLLVRVPRFTNLIALNANMMRNYNDHDLAIGCSLVHSLVRRRVLEPGPIDGSTMVFNKVIWNTNYVEPKIAPDYVTDKLEDEIKLKLWMDQNGQRVFKPLKISIPFSSSNLGGHIPMIGSIAPSTLTVSAFSLINDRTIFLRRTGTIYGRLNPRNVFIRCYIISYVPLDIITLNSEGLLAPDKLVTPSLGLSN